MEPILPAPHYENSSHQEREAAPPSPSITTPETAPNTRVEGTKEATTSTTPSHQLSTPQVPSLVDNHTSDAVATDVTQNGLAVGMPLIADDVDVIEKEWVDKAKKIVNSTKSDPREQEKEVNKLQADYLLKRYNKQIKLTE